MKYISVKEASKKWGITERRVRILCSENRIDGVVKSSWAWNIPSTAKKPSDGRVLRHIKNIDLRVDSLNFNDLVKKKDIFNSITTNLKESEKYFDDSVNRFLLFALHEEDIEASDILLVLNNPNTIKVNFEIKTLILNSKSIIINIYKQTGYGPILPSDEISNPFICEKRLKNIYQSIFRNIDDYYIPNYRFEMISNPSSFDLKEYDILKQVEALIFQYERDWIMLNALVKASFMFAGLLRIKPFEKHMFLFASIVFSAILLEHGYPLAIIPVSLIDELKANLILTLKRSNYTKLINMFETSLIKELDVLINL